MNIIRYSIRSFFTNEYYSIIRFASKRLFVATLTYLQQQTLTLYSIKEHGIKHLVSWRSSFLYIHETELNTSLYWCNIEEFLQKGISSITNLCQKGLHPALPTMLFSTQYAKLYWGSSSHGLWGRFRFSCLIACNMFKHYTKVY